MQHLARVDDAQRELTVAHRLAPWDAKVLHALVIFFYQERKWDNALMAAERLSQLLPEDPNVAALLAEIRRAATAGRGEGQPKQEESKQP